MHCSSRVGDESVIGQESPVWCPWAFYCLFPFAQVLQFGGSFPVEKDPDRAVVACLDAGNPVVFELRRTRPQGTVAGPEYGVPDDIGGAPWLP